MQIIRMEGVMATTPGLLAGTSASEGFLNQINSQTNAHLFGTPDDMFSSVTNKFIQDFVIPIKQAAVTLGNVVNSIMAPNLIRPLETKEDLKAIPSAMHIPLLCFEPIRQLLEAGRISGFGYTPDMLPEEDAYGRLINNGNINSHTSEAKGQYYPLKYNWRSDDPEISFEECQAIKTSRQLMLEILESTHFDPTDYPNHRS